jgi:hypothetical protein
MKSINMKLKHILFTTLAYIGIANTSQAQVPNYVPSNGLVGWWPFNGNSNDESGNGNNGTVNGAILTPDRNGNVNNAYSFDGINDIIAVNNISNLNSEWTISFWFYANSDNIFEMQSLIGIGNSPNMFGGGGFTINGGISPGQCSVFDSNHNTMQLTDASETCGQLLFSDNYLNQTWYNIIIKYSNSNYSIYVDNIESVSGTLNSIIPSELFFGNRADMTFQFFKGILDDIGIWNRALTDQEIELLYNGCTVPTNEIVGNITPEVFVAETYTCIATQGSTYQWSVSNGVITSGQGTNSVSVLWAGTGLGTISVQETTSANCQGDTISVDVVVIPTGLEEIGKSTFKVYPNPANEIIHLNFAAKTTTAVSVSVTDLSGRLVMNSNSTAVVAGKNTLSINTSALQTGMYFITLSDGKSQQSFRVSVSK